MSTKIILVVEDNEAAREGLGVILRKEGHEVVLAANGQQALDLIRGGLCPNLIVLDMLLPVLDGWQFLQQMRRLQPPLTIPTLVATATILTREWASDNGCQGFLRKPIEAEQLLAEVGRCLG
jgi:CheY-like chemotaxis protein